MLGLLAGIAIPVLLPYPLFVLTYLRRWRLPFLGPPPLQLLITTALCPFVLETCACLHHFVRNSLDPALFHPQLVPDLIISIGVYPAWWLTWWLALKRYRFNTVQVFLTTGAYGVFIEQGGRVFLAGLDALPLGIFYWLFIIVVYGSAMTLAFYLVRGSFSTRRDNWLKYPLTWGLLLFLTASSSIGWNLFLNTLGFLPPAKFPIQTYPFW